MNKQNHFIALLKHVTAVLVLQLTLLSAQNNIVLEELNFDDDLKYGELSILDNSDDIILNFVGDGVIPARIVISQFFNYIKNNGLNLEFKFSSSEVDKYAAEMAIKLPQNSNLLTQMVTAETPIPKGELFSISLIELNRSLAQFNGRPDELREALYRIYDDRNKVKADQIQNN